MKYTVLAILLISSIILPAATANNCPPNALHCDIFLEIGDDGSYVLVQFGVNGTLLGNNTIPVVNPGGSAHVWANVTLAANATVTSANISIEIEPDDTGLEFPGSTSQDVVATAASQNFTFPFTPDIDFALGDIVFLPVTVEHQDAAARSTHIPIQIGTAAPTDRVVVTPTSPLGEDDGDEVVASPTEDTPLGPVAIAGLLLAALALASRRRA